MRIYVLYRLDAKSSRGMIYENEELRIRTININAEVERGTISLYFLQEEINNHLLLLSSYISFVDIIKVNLK